MSKVKQPGVRYPKFKHKGKPTKPKQTKKTGSPDWEEYAVTGDSIMGTIKERTEDEQG